MKRGFLKDVPKRPASNDRQRGFLKDVPKRPASNDRQLDVEDAGRRIAPIFTAQAQDLTGFSFGQDSTAADTELVNAMRACSLFAQALKQPQQTSSKTETSAATQGVMLQDPSHFYHVLGLPRDADERSIVLAHAFSFIRGKYSLV